MKAMTCTFLEVEAKIKSIAFKFWRTYGGDLAVLTAEASYHFVGAYNNYKPDKTHFENYLSFYIWKQLLETARTEAKRRRKLGNRHDVSDVFIESYSSTIIDSLVAELSDDAKYVIRLVTSPDGLPDKIQSKNYLGVRKNLKRFLTDDEKWTPERVESVFQEIGESL